MIKKRQPTSSRDLPSPTLCIHGQPHNGHCSYHAVLRSSAGAADVHKHEGLACVASAGDLMWQRYRSCTVQSMSQPQHAQPAKADHQRTTQAAAAPRICISTCGPHPCTPAALSLRMRAAMPLDMSEPPGCSDLACSGPGISSEALGLL